MAADDTQRFDDVDDRATDPFISLGVSYRVNRRWSVQAEWNRYDLSGERLNTLGFEARYCFGASDRE